MNSAADTADEMLVLACQGLEASVRKCFKRKCRHWSESQQKVRRRAALEEALPHAQFALRQLHAKRASLQHGVDVLKDVCWKQCLERLRECEKDALFSVLQHVMYQYLRLRDGLVLLESGECRHAGDVREAQTRQARFASKLSTLSTRKDGYTRLFSSDMGYSGFGWDEMFDPEVGIQARLLGALSGKWETLLDHGAQAFESCLDQHEVLVKEATEKLEQFRQKFVRDVQDWAGPTGTVRMLTQDKMERLEVAVPSRGLHISLERRASDFQVADPEGVLPNGWTTREWTHAMQLPPLKKNAVSVPAAQTSKRPTNKRRIIEEDSSEDESNENAVSGGLRVRVEATDNKRLAQKSTSDDFALTDIKSSLGVDAEGLEAAREGLEAEGNDIKEPSGHGESSNEIQELQADVQLARIKVQRLERIFARLKEESEDDCEVWDARECLREALMMLGIHLRDMNFVVDKSGGCESSEKLLTEARSRFQGAVDLIAEQEVAHEALLKQSYVQSEDACMIRRNLLLLRGRAHMNLGITSTELSTLNGPAAVRKRCLADAASELQLAQKCAVDMRVLADKDRKRGASITETSLDTVRADQLDSSASRWLGCLRWRQGKHREAVRDFEKAWNLMNTVSENTNDPDLLEEKILLGVECFFSCATLCDLADEALRKLHITERDREQRRQALEKGDELFQMATNGCRRGAQVSASLETLSKRTVSRYSFGDLQREHDVRSSNEMKVALSQLQTWWEQKKAGQEELLHGNGDLVARRQRNDLFANGSAMTNSIPGRRFVVGGRRKRPQQRRGHGRASQSHSRGGFPDELQLNATEPPVQYRKWGDQLLPQVKSESGEMVAKLVYPACAPERPPGF